MQKKATSMNLTVDALRLLGELAALYGVTKTSVMEYAVRELYNKRVSRQWWTEVDMVTDVAEVRPLADEWGVWSTRRGGE